MSPSATRRVGRAAKSRLRVFGGAQIVEEMMAEARAGLQPVAAGAA